MCTGIRLIADDSSVVCARTLEFAKNIESQIMVIPRNLQLTGSGLVWKSKFAAMGTNASGETGIIDGINEKGLAGGLFYFPEFAQYQEATSSEKFLAPWEILTWILTNCVTIDEVKKELSNIKVTNTVFDAWGIIPPIHAIIHDPFGNSLVIEYIKGNLVLTDNPLGVLTNSPAFDWHIINLRNYINLSAFNISELELKNIKLTPLGQGSGMLGLPGDFTSPSRFIRAVAYSQSVVNIKNDKDAIKTAFHILNLFDIPYGSVRQKEDSKVHCELTQWTSATDLKNKIYYIHTYDNRNVQIFELNKMNLNADKPIIINL